MRTKKNGKSDSWNDRIESIAQWIKWIGGGRPGPKWTIGDDQRSWRERLLWRHCCCLSNEWPVRDFGKNTKINSNQLDGNQRSAFENGRENHPKTLSLLSYQSTFIVRPFKVQFYSYSQQMRSTAFPVRLAQLHCFESILSSGVWALLILFLSINPIWDSGVKNRSMSFRRSFFFYPVIVPRPSILHHFVWLKTSDLIVHWHENNQNERNVD